MKNRQAAGIWLNTSVDQGKLSLHWLLNISFMEEKK